MCDTGGKPACIVIGVERATPEEIGYAKEFYEEKGEIEFDSDALVSRVTEEGCDNGVWVQGWAYLPSSLFTEEGESDE